MANVAPPMRISVTMKVYFRPIISPIRPKNNAPNGRTTKPAAKVAKVAKKEAVAFSFGKNWVEIILAKLPKIKKSYHSMSVPTVEAAMMATNSLVEVLGWVSSIIIQAKR